MSAVTVRRYSSDGVQEYRGDFCGLKQAFGCGETTYGVVMNFKSSDIEVSLQLDASELEHLVMCLLPAVRPGSMVGP